MPTRIRVPLLFILTIFSIGCASISPYRQNPGLPDFTNAYEETRKVVVWIQILRKDLGKPDDEPDLVSGSGFILFSRKIEDAYESLVVTNAHLLEGAKEIKVHLFDGTKLRAEIFSHDKAHDLALIKLRTSSALPTAKLGDSSLLKIGEWVFAVGSPHGLKWSLSVGVVGNLHKNSLGSIQFDGNIYPGNSGGGLFNLKNELIGVATAYLSDDRGRLRVGFAIPINLLKVLLPGLLRDGDMDNKNRRK